VRFGGGPAEKKGQGAEIQSQGQQNHRPISEGVHAEHAPITTPLPNNSHAKQAATMAEQHSPPGLLSMRDGALEFYETREPQALGVIRVSLERIAERTNSPLRNPSPCFDELIRR
jgi:hypothetical protein